MAGRKDRFDWITFVLFFTLVVIGWLMQYAVSEHEVLNTRSIFEGSLGRHTAWVLVSLVVFLIGQILDERTWRTLAYAIFALSIILLILVLLVGEEINNARSWFVIAGFSFQPGEFAKLGTTLALCAYLSSFQTRLKAVSSQLIAVGLVSLPMILILLQPDAGSALVFLSFFILFFREGMPISYYALTIYAGISMMAALIFPLNVVIIGLALFVLMFFLFNLIPVQRWAIVMTAVLAVTLVHFLYFPLQGWVWILLILGFTVATIYLALEKRQRTVTFVLPVIMVVGVAMAFLSDFVFDQVLQPHQQDRLNAWLQPSKGDPQGSLYNIIQSKVAIGSGGFTGKGFLEGTMTQLNYVPEQATDFIFSTIGEEQGFVGSLSVIFLFLGLILRILYIGEKRENDFIRIYAYGLAGILFVHFFVNIGMTMGLVPVVGIPLPFISKGGTALVVFSLMISIFLKLAKSRI